jgi:hypothetical protein
VLEVPVSGGYKYRDMTLQVGGVSKFETVKYGRESRGTRTRETLRKLHNYRPRTLVREGAPHKTRNCLKMIKERRIIGRGLRFVANTRTDWPTACWPYRNVDLTLEILEDKGMTDNEEISRPLGGALLSPDPTFCEVCPPFRLPLSQHISVKRL